MARGGGYCGHHCAWDSARWTTSTPHPAPKFAPNLEGRSPSTRCSAGRELVASGPPGLARQGPTANVSACGPRALQLATYFSPAAGREIVFRWLWAGQQAATDAWATRVFVDQVTGVNVTGAGLLAAAAARRAATGGVTYIVHPAACRLLCNDLVDLMKHLAVHFVLRDLRLAAAAGALAHHAHVAAVVVAVPAALLVNAHYLNGHHALARAHIVLLVVASCCVVRHVVALAMTIHLAVA